MPKRAGNGPTDSFAIRRAEIVDVAAHLFAENGYAATGIAQIGAAVELARGALYYYIDSKETLLNEIHDRVMDPLLAAAAGVQALDASVGARLRLISEALLTQIIERHDHVWVFLHEYRALTGERFAYFRQRRRQFEDYVSDLLDEGRKEGIFNFEDTRLATLGFLNLHNYTYQWVHAEGRLSANDLSSFYCKVFFDGLAGSSTFSSAVEAEVARLGPFDTLVAGSVTAPVGRAAGQAGHG